MRELYQIIRRYQYSFRLLNISGLPHNDILTQPFLAFELTLVPGCTKEDYRKAIMDAVTPVSLTNDCLELQISLIKPKYQMREKPPTIMVRNKELNLPLRQILEDFIMQMLMKVKEPQKDKDDWLFSFLKLLETIVHSLMEKAISKQLTQLNELERKIMASY